MSYKSCHAQYVNPNTYKIHLWDDEGYKSFSWNFYAYEECDPIDADKNIRGLRHETLRKVTKWDKENPKLHFHDIKPYQRFLIDKYGTNDEPSTTHREIFFDIEIEMGGALTEEYIKNAPKPVTSIAWWYKQKDEWVILILDSKGELEYTHEGNKKIIPLKTEQELLMKFLEYIRTINPDILVGYNCIPKNSRIWKWDEILEIQNSHEGDILGGVEDKIVQYVSSGMKQEYNIKLGNGNIIKSSKNHVFPVYEKTLKYQNLNQLLKSKSDKKVEDLIKINNDLYFEVIKGNNPNPNQTYEILGGGIDIISDNDLYLLGLIFTDGWYHNEKTDKSSISISNSCTTLIKNIIPIINENRTSRFQLNSINDLTPSQSKDYPNAKPNYSIKIGSRHNNGGKFNLLKSLIYDGDNKSLNINLLSKLSTSQFTSFVSGMIDGDGGIRKKFLSYCNYENNIHKFHELLLWNGVYSTIEGNNTILNIPYCNIFNNKEFIDNLNLRGYKKFQKENILKYFKFNNKPSLNSKKYILEDKVLIRIQEINNTGKKVEMCDISTEKGYFIYEGIKTHNCDYFDIPYLYFRMCKIFDAEIAGMLSPIGLVRDESEWNEHRWLDIAGLESLDYMKLHKKFSFKDEPSYKLDFLGKKYVNIEKVEYDGSLDRLFKEDKNKFIQYNFRDVEILKALDEKFQYLPLTKNLAHKGKIRYSDVYKNSFIHDGAISAYLLSQGIIPPSRDKNPITKKNYAGGYLFCPKAGLYKYMFDEDLTSLYPSIIMSLNIGKETLVGRIIIPDEKVIVENKEIFNCRYGLNDLKQMDSELVLTIQNAKRKSTQIKVKDIIDLIESENLAISANGVMYRTDFDSVLKTILSKWFDERVIYKNKMKQSYKAGNKADGEKYHLMQHTMKILLNSLYGATALGSFRYGNVVLSESITLSGQRIIQESALFANTHMNQVLKGETTL